MELGIPILNDVHQRTIFYLVVVAVFRLAVFASNGLAFLIDERFLIIKGNGGQEQGGLSVYGIIHHYPLLIPVRTTETTRKVRELTTDRIVRQSYFSQEVKPLVLGRGAAYHQEQKQQSKDFFHTLYFFR